MQRASQLFDFEETIVQSPFVEKIWRTHSEPADRFLSIAASHWEMVVLKLEGQISLFIRGPETRATSSPIPQDAEFIGIQFTPGAFMPRLPVDQLVDAAVMLPNATATSVWLNGSAWDLPDYDNADTFVARLVREGLLVRDPIVEAALQGSPGGRSSRSLQRRFLRATGLTQIAFKQIERANQAVALLDRGISILDVVEKLGYADQPHLTRALKRFVGQTPAQIARGRPGRV